MKKLTLVVLLGILLLLSGCGQAAENVLTTLPEGMRDALAEAINSGRWSLQDPIDEFFAAVDARDTDAVRAMFSPNVQGSDEDLDESIQALFDLYPGPTEDCQMTSPVGASKHLSYGRRTMVNIHNAFPVVCGGVNYYCSFSYTTKDEEDPGNVGIKMVVLSTEAAKCHPDYYQNSLELEDGLSVVTTPAVEGETRRIGDQPFAFTPVERTISREDLTDFLETDDSWDGFTARFGPPNAEGHLNTGCYYELIPEDGQPRYVHILTHDFGDGEKRVYSIYLQNDHDYRELDTVWTNPKKEKQ